MLSHIRLRDKSTAKQIRMVIGHEAPLLQEGLLLRASLLYILIYGTEISV